MIIAKKINENLEKFSVTKIFPTRVKSQNLMEK